MPINFACVSPHPPLLLPSVGSTENRKKVKKTIIALEKLEKIFTKVKPELVIISSPHKNWGFDVPLYFLLKAKNKPPVVEVGFSSEQKKYIKTYLTGLESPQFYFEEGKKIYETQIKNSKANIALIASANLSHRLKGGSSYGLHPDGRKFDKALMEYLKKKDIKSILKLNEMYPKSGECGLRSICFLLGILKAAGVEGANANWKPEILSYEKPFGVGYLVASIKIYRSFRVYTY